MSEYNRNIEQRPSQYQRYSINNYEPSNENSFRNLNYNDTFSQDFNKQLSVQQEPTITYEKRVHYLVISSADRNVSLYPSSSNFTIDIDDSLYKNIVSIELIQSTIPDKNFVQSEPYLLLNIEEFKSNNVMYSLNKPISDSFAILLMSPPTTAGSFIQLDKRLHENTPIVFQTPKSKLSRFTITVTDADGNIFDFGGSGSTAKATQVTFALKIVTLHSNTSKLNVRGTF